MSVAKAVIDVLSWFAGLPLKIVASQSLMAGLVLSGTEATGWNDWGHEGMLLAVVPIVGVGGCAPVLMAATASSPMRLLHGRPGCRKYSPGKAGGIRL